MEMHNVLHLCLIVAQNCIHTTSPDMLVKGLPVVLIKASKQFMRPDEICRDHSLLGQDGHFELRPTELHLGQKLRSIMFKFALGCWH